MTSWKQISINIENYGNVNIYYAYTQYTTFENFLEFIIDNYPNYNICHCYKFQGIYNQVSIYSIINNKDQKI